jgi:hypothetical protein
MDHQIKLLAEAVESPHAKKLIESHVKALHFENNHLIVYVDNAHPFHEMIEEKMEHHFKVGMEKVYGEDITYEFKLHKSNKPNEEEKETGREYNFSLIRGQKKGKK